MELVSQGPHRRASADRVGSPSGGDGTVSCLVTLGLCLVQARSAHALTKIGHDGVGAETLHVVLGLGVSLHHGRVRVDQPVVTGRRRRRSTRHWHGRPLRVRARRPRRHPRHRAHDLGRPQVRGRTLRRRRVYLSTAAARGPAYPEPFVVVLRVAPCWRCAGLSMGSELPLFDKENEDEEVTSSMNAQVAQAEKAAEDVLRSTWCVDIEGCALPIDPVQIARLLGIQVYTLPFDDRSLAGMLRKERDGDPEIFLNSNDHPNRQRFTCAHEIGHYDYRSQFAGDQWEYVDYRSTMSSRGTVPEEKYANAFAAALLMPRAKLEPMFHELERTALALQFQVSLEAMGHRITNLGLTR